MFPFMPPPPPNHNMTKFHSAFLPNDVLYFDSKEYRNAVEQVDQGKYELICFMPNKTNECFILMQYDNLYAILHTEYDLTSDRCYPNGHDTLRLFDSRDTAFRYLQKVTSLV